MLAISITEGITKEYLQQVYSEPYIARAGHDHRKFEPVSHPLATYLSAFVDGEFAGAFLAIRTSQMEIEVHALLKKEFALQSRQLGHAFLAWAFSKSDVQRVCAPIIESLESVRNYCLKLGFRQEGFKRNAVMKDGVTQGIFIMGVIKEDWSKI